jgi:flagellar biosynthesis/type III secretory pathway chaperone
MSAATSGTPTPIASASEAEHAIENLNKIMDRLVDTVEEETARVRAGHLRDAVELDEAKVELARLYACESERVKAAKDIIAKSLPEALDDLRRRHDAFQALLQTNLTVLATAHAVSEGIIRGVSGELARKQAPSTYGATGRASTPSSKASQPLAVSRTL